jgi:hypothetical protein
MIARRLTTTICGLVASIIVSGGPALAQQRIEATQQSCSALQGLVQRNRQVLIYTAPYLYDTYVTSCGVRPGQFPAYLRTRDNPQCFVGYTCGQSSGAD